MDTILRGIFGGQEGDDRPYTQAQDFVGRYEEGPPWTNFSGQEALERYRQVAPQLPPEQFERAAEQAFGRMDPQQRLQFAQMLQQRAGGFGAGTDFQLDDPRQLARLTTQFQRQEPEGLAALFGGGGRERSGGLGDLIDNPIAKAALGGIAAMAFKQMIGKR
jgi:hypothetical protein